MSDVSQERPETSLAAKLGRLFDEIRHPSDTDHPGKRFTLDEVTSAIRAKFGDIGLSSNYLSALRTGAKNKPSEKVREAICDFFGVPSDHLDPQPLVSAAQPRTQEELDVDVQLAALARNHGVRQMAFRALTELDPVELSTVLSVVDAVLSQSKKSRGLNGEQPPMM